MRIRRPFPMPVPPLDDLEGEDLDGDLHYHAPDLLERPERPNVRRPLASGVRVA